MEGDVLPEIKAVVGVVQLLPAHRQAGLELHVGVHRQQGLAVLVGDRASAGVVGLIGE